MPNPNAGSGLYNFTKSQKWGCFVNYQTFNFDINIDLLRIRKAAPVFGLRFFANTRDILRDLVEERSANFDIQNRSVSLEQLGLPA